MSPIADHAPDTPEWFEQGRRQAEEFKRQDEERRWERREEIGPRVAIAHAVARTLGRADWSPADRMRALSLLCFSREIRPYANVDGDWSDLDSPAQIAVLRACREGLEEGSPSPLPGIRGFSGVNYAEGRAFATIAADPANAGWLDATLIGQWLPIVVRTNLSNSLDAVRACGGADRAATAAVLVVAVEEEARAGEQRVTTASDIPAELWPGEVARRVAALVEDGSLDVEARIGLLGNLADRVPEMATPIVVRFTDGADSPVVPAELRRRTIDIRLELDPEGAIPLIEAEFWARGRDALLELPSLGYHSQKLRSDLATWPTPLLTRLGVLLVAAYPPSGPFVEETGCYEVTPDHELRWTRDRVLDVLFDRRAVEGDAILAPLVALDPILGDRSAWERSQR